MATSTQKLTAPLVWQQMGQARPARATIAADPLREYVTGGWSSWTYSPDWLRSLPFYVDDLTQQFGDDLYERMLLDDKVASCIQSLKLGALEQGVSLLPAIADEADAAYKRAVEIRDFCQRALERLELDQEGGEDGILGVLTEMLDAMAYGNRVAELVYDTPTSGPLTGKLTLSRIKPKPRRSVAFVVDPMNNCRGLLGIIPGVLSPLMVDTTLIDPKLPNLLPRSKFAVLTYRLAKGTSGDPRGSSVLRAAYNAWWLKQQATPEQMKYLAVFAVPSIIGYTAPEAGEEFVYGPDGVPLEDEDGNPQTITAQQAMLNALIRLRNNSAAAFPNGAATDVIEGREGTEPFEAFREARNREISDAITGQTLATSEGQHQARSASEVHQDEKALRISYARRAVATMIRRDILATLVRLNFGEEEAAALTPAVSLSGTQPEDWSEVAGAVGTLWQQGYLSPSQLSWSDQKLGAPARTTEEMKAITEQKLAPPPEAGSPNGNSSAEREGESDDGEDHSRDAEFAEEEEHWVTINGHPVKIKGVGDGQTNRVSSAFDISASGAVRGHIDRAIAAVDKVHVGARLPKIRVDVVEVPGASGQYFSDEREPGQKFEARRIVINPSKRVPALTMLHEIGHFLDEQLIGEGDRFASRDHRNVELREWRRAVRRSAAVNQLRDIERSARASGLRVDAGVMSDARRLLRPEEVWARSYAQYITTKSGDAEVLRQLNVLRQKAPGRPVFPVQWDDADFEPIAKAFDKIFAKRGLLR